MQVALMLLLHHITVLVLVIGNKVVNEMKPIQCFTSLEHVGQR